MRNSLCFQEISWTDGQVLLQRSTRMLRDWCLRNKSEDAAMLERWAINLGTDASSAPARAKSIFDCVWSGGGCGCWLGGCETELERRSLQPLQLTWEQTLHQPQQEQNRYSVVCGVGAGVVVGQEGVKPETHVCNCMNAEPSTCFE
jgi:hypothetical protein